MGPHLETDTMRCKSGKHEWTDQVDAERCCNPEWERQGRPLAFGIEDMDQDGRRFVVTGGLMWVYGWVRRRRPDAAELPF